MIYSILGDGPYSTYCWCTQHRTTATQNVAPPHFGRWQVSQFVYECVVAVLTIVHYRFDAYRKASEQFTIAQADITSPVTAAAQIDSLLVQLITHVRPVYLTLPTNMVAVKISSASLATPLKPIAAPNNTETEKFVLEEIAKLAKAAHESDDGKDGIIILVDACAIRHGVRDEVKSFVEKTGFPVYAAPMGKTAIDEDWERYGGVRDILCLCLSF